MFFILALVSYGVGSVAAVSSLAGVNIAGFDFGVEITGTANLNNAQGPLKALGNSDGLAQMQHFVKNDGLNMFRLPVSWQFLIASETPPTNPTNGTSIKSTTSSTKITIKTGTFRPRAANNTAANSGALDPTNFAQYDTLVQSCLGTGATCVIDIHNYARFNNKVIGQGGPSDEAFAFLWSQIATKYATTPNLIFGLMNEPHDIPSLPTWTTTVQKAVSAIRLAGAITQTILLPGTDFTGAQTFISNGSARNLSTVHNPDGSNTSLAFDVHKYLDVDGSGTHTECVGDHVKDTFEPLARFLREEGRMALLSETGGGNDTSCLAAFCTTIAFINANPDVYLGYAGWAAGGFSPDTYNLTMTPQGSNGSFVDQQIVSQCLVGQRNGGEGGNRTNGTSRIQSPGIGSPPVTATTKEFTGGAGRVRDGRVLGLLGWASGMALGLSVL
ncbi:glycoside hydrolase family 5 protein [Amylocarpus encephaloides]|uniref:cellulase n=1 Tax=Amylocarpus encephaloides TaxID=45428 RepID=A0A9P7YK57_9HELO|nr:glycoside hydrolase family 5 protein [Amylocarpus encephaloides]